MKFTYNSSADVVKEKKLNNKDDDIRVNMELDLVEIKDKSEKLGVVANFNFSYSANLSDLIIYFYSR